MPNSLRLNTFSSRGKFLLSGSDAQYKWHPLSLALGQQNIQCSYAWNSSFEQDQLYISCRENISTIERAYVEAFCELASSLSWSKIEILGTRELENFLRDDNLSPAHDDFESGSIPGLWIESVRGVIFSGWLKSRLGLMKPLSEPQKGPLELAKWLQRLRTPEFWGKKVKPDFLKYEPVALIPTSADTSATIEIQWRFSENISPSEAQLFCSTLEQFLHEHAHKVKVVAES